MTVQERPTARKLTHYQVLMVDQDVDDDVLTEVYHRLVKRARQADMDDDRRARVLRAIERAYAVLHDPIRRSLYDLELQEREDAWSPPGGEQDRAPVSVAAPSAAAAPAPVGTAPAARPATTPATPAPAARPPATSHSGARVLDFGRYAGWTLRQIAMRDRDYLEWLRRTPLGRQYQAEIAAILTPR